MRRNLPQPLDPGVLHGDIGIEPLRDRMADERGALLLEHSDQLLLLGNERVDPGGLAVEEARDAALLRKRGNADFKSLQSRLGDGWIRYS